MNDDKLARVRKLLAQADSVAGTHEADVFNTKAFDLIARYGLDETQARMRETTGPAPVERYEFAVEGTYQLQQAFLFQVLAKAVHCAPIRSGELQIVYGSAANIERLKLLFATLRMQMFSGAEKITGRAGTTTRRARLSWMVGFAESVSDRLGAAERAAVEDTIGADLVHVSDAHRANDALRDEFNRMRKGSSSTRLDPAAYGSGQKAGEHADIGNKRMAARRALTA